MQRSFIVWCDNIDKKRVDEESFLEYCVKVGEGASFEPLRKICLDAGQAVFSETDGIPVSSVRVFDHTIEPHCEDPENAHGGSVCVEVEFAKWSMCYWLNVLSMFLFDDTPVTHVVNGVVLTRRSSTWLLSIWFNEYATDDDKGALSNQLRLITDSSDSMNVSHEPPKPQAIHDEQHPTTPPAPIDYDKELHLLAKKYGRHATVHCDSFNVMGTVLITALLTVYRLVDWHNTSVLATSLAGLHVV